MANLSTLFGAGIKSIQTGTITIPNASLTATVTITAVTLGKAFLLNGGTVANAPAATLDNNMIGLTLTNSTTITATRINSSGAPLTNWTVVEFF